MSTRNFSNSLKIFNPTLKTGLFQSFHLDAELESKYISLRITVYSKTYFIFNGVTRCGATCCNAARNAKRREGQTNVSEVNNMTSFYILHCILYKAYNIDVHYNNLFECNLKHL